MIIAKNNKVLRIVTAFLFALVFTCILARPVSAETKVVQIAELDTKQDLAVSFMFQKEVVEMTFISPSGKRLDSKSDGVEYATKDLWAVYRIKDAEAGKWSVEYDLGSNAYIDYSIISDDLGIFIQNFEIKNTDSTSATASFEVTKKGDNVEYSYEILALDTSDDTSETVTIRESSAWTNEKVEKNVSLSDLSSGTYIFALKVYYSTGTGEVFDNYQTEPFSYVNPNTPGEISDYVVYVDKANGSCVLDWKEYTSWFYQQFKIVITADDTVIFSNKLPGDLTTAGITFPEGTKILTVDLQYKNDHGLWSETKTKTIDLEKNYIAFSDSDVTTVSEAVLDYSVNGNFQVKVTINDEFGYFNLSPDSHEIRFPITTGSNTLYAEALIDENIVLISDKVLIYDYMPPIIKLFDNIDGKVFLTDSVDIIGNAGGAISVKVNGEEVTLGNNGDFVYTFVLTEKENIAVITAADVNGNESAVTLTLYRADNGATIADVKNGGDDSETQGFAGFVKKYMPLLIGLAVSVVAVLFALITFKKRVKGQIQPVKMWHYFIIEGLLLVGEGALIFVCIKRRIYEKSVDFLEVAERSVYEALDHVSQTDALFRTALICGIVLAILIALTVSVAVLIHVRRKKK